MINVLVTGGTGFIGRRLVSLLYSSGSYQVYVLSREAEIDLPEGAVSYIGDLLDSDLLEHILPNVEIVFHLAGEKHDVSLMHRVNVNGTKRLLAAGCAAGVKAFVYISSASVVGRNNSEIVTEATPCHPITEYGCTKYAAEKLVLSYQGKMPVVVLRPVSVFGDGDPEKRLQTLWRTIKSGRFFYLGNKYSIVNRVYVEDCALACLHLGQYLLDKEISNGNVYFLSDPRYLYEMVDLIADYVHVKSPKLILPAWLGWIFAWIGDRISRLGITFPLTVSRMEAMTDTTLYKSSKLRSLLTNISFVGWKDGVRRTIEYYEKQ
jgi:nucleoside-diphosphate-sugar epimerase